jgi:hypothetical protein
LINPNEIIMNMNRLDSMASSFVLFGIDFSLIHWLEVFYVVVAIVVTAGGASQLLSTGSGRAIIFAIGSILLFVFFGYRWFGNASDAPLTWPPTINTCPDFLTFVPKISGMGTSNASGGGCVDMLGVSSNGGMQKMSRTGLAAISKSTSPNLLFPYTSADIAANADKQNYLSGVCGACKVGGITWEGVYDGDTCLALSRAGVLLATKDAAAQCATTSLKQARGFLYG